MKSAAVCWPGIMSYFGLAIRPYLAGHYVFAGRISVQTAPSKAMQSNASVFILLFYSFF